jgi:predicted transcriptional regulator
VHTRRAQVGRILGRPDPGAGLLIWRGVHQRQVADLAAGFAHPQRVLLLRTLMEGATRYSELRAALGAKAGPLYHHIRQLRLCGLLEAGPRDTYHLTLRGRLAAGVMCALDRLLAGLGSVNSGPSDDAR